MNDRRKITSTIWKIFRKSDKNWIRWAEFSIVVLGVFIAASAFFIESEDRRNQRLVNAWQIALKEAPGSSGKISALQYLHKNKVPLFQLNMSSYKHGAPVYLQGIDLYYERDDLGPYVPNSSFEKAILRRADLRNGTFNNACLRGADLSNARLDRADLTDADLSGAKLIDTNVSGTIFDKTNISATRFETNVGLKRDQLKTAFYCDKHGGPPVLPNGFPLPEKQECKNAQGCLWNSEANDG